MNATNGRAAILGSRSKPSRMSVEPENIPDQLLRLDRWLGWRWEWNPDANGGGGKLDKPPVNLLTDGFGSSTNPETWCDFQSAYEASERERVDGVGFALGDLGDGLTLVGVDLDDCRNPETGELTPEAETVIRKIGGYWEISPSGTGVKGLFYGTKPRGKCKRGDFEIYGGGRYFTITGRLLPGCSRELIDASEALRWFHETFIDPPKPSSQSTANAGDDATRAVELLNGLNPARADDYGDWTLAGMALKSVSPDLFAAWDSWSQRSDKYNADECRRKWESFNGSGVGIGSLYHWATQDGWTPPRREWVFDGDRWHDADSLQGRAAGQRRVTYQRITSPELAAGDFAVEYLIEDVLVRLQPLLAAGPYKSLKTFILVAIAVALDAGVHFLGRFRVNRRCKVCVMSGESGLATIQENARLVCAANDLRLEDLGIIWSPDLPMFGDPAHMEALEAFLVADAVEVLILDPVYLSMSGADAGNLFIQGALLRNISDLCQRLGVTLILAHHTKRNTGRDPYDVPELADVAWSGFAEFSRQWLLLNRRERYEPGTGQHALWLSCGGSAGHSSIWALDVDEGVRGSLEGRRWSVAVSNPSEARTDADQRRSDAKAARQSEQLHGDAKAIVDAIAMQPERVATKAVIKATAGINTNRLDAALAALIKARDVTPATIVKGNNRTYDAFKLGGCDDQ